MPPIANLPSRARPPVVRTENHMASKQKRPSNSDGPNAGNPTPSGGGQKQRQQQGDSGERQQGGGGQTVQSDRPGKQGGRQHQGGQDSH